MEHIGFIGLGIMGKPMARNLLKAGYPLTVHNRSRGAVDKLAGEGATPASSPRAVAERSDVVITMLPDVPTVEQVIAGENGVLAGSRAGMLVVDMSTSTPALARELAEQAGKRGVAMLDAPVSGGDVGAREGTLSIMAGGSDEAFSRAEPIFRVLGKTVVHAGGEGMGQVVKACNQIVVALTLEAISEALVLGSKAGADPAVILQALSGGFAGSKVMEVRGRNFLDHDFTPGARVSIHHKDLGIALAAGRQYGVALPVTGLVDSMFQALEARGQADQDHSALLTILEDWAQHRIGKGL